MLHSSPQTRLVLGRSLIAVLALTMIGASGHLVQKWSDGQPGGSIQPFLQRPAPDAISVRWRTLEPMPSELAWRQRGSGEWNLLSDPAPKREHSLRIPDLQADTVYQYRASSGPRAGTVFECRTPPAIGSSAPVRALVLGDPGDATPALLATRAAVERWLDAHPRADRGPLDLLLTTGDNAYRSGRDVEYRDHFFAPWADWFSRVPVWPVLGNHDRRRWAFFRIFEFPENGESGGVASGSERYYAFDHGAVHFVILDSETSDLSADGAMAQWLERDLAASSADWVIALFHRPPYTRGTHDSEKVRGSNWRIGAMREIFVPILERHGVDLVISGHSHNYERSRPLRNSTDESKPRRRPSGECDITAFADRWSASCGTTYIVLGNSAHTRGAPLDHPVMVRGEARPGALLLDIEPGRLEGRFLAADGSIGDHFTVLNTNAAPDDAAAASDQRRPDPNPS